MSPFDRFLNRSLTSTKMFWAFLPSLFEFVSSKFPGHQFCTSCFLHRLALCHTIFNPRYIKLPTASNLPLLNRCLRFYARAPVGPFMVFLSEKNGYYSQLGSLLCCLSLCVRACQLVAARLSSSSPRKCWWRHGRPSRMFHFSRTQP